jgi:hypothetical protein
MSGSDRYLIPRPRGVVQAMRARADDARRRLVLALLRGGADRPMQLPEIGRLAGLPDSQSVGTLLFRLQREEWLDGDVEPLRLPVAPLAEALPALLGELSSGGCAVLGTVEGLVYARVGFENRTAEQIAILSAGLRPLLDRVAPEALASATENELHAWGVLDPRDRPRLMIVPLQFGTRCLYLALGAEPRLEASALVQLVALLSRRYERDSAH